MRRRIDAKKEGSDFDSNVTRGVDVHCCSSTRSFIFGVSCCEREVLSMSGVKGQKRPRLTRDV